MFLIVYMSNSTKITTNTDTANWTLSTLDSSPPAIWVGGWVNVDFWIHWHLHVVSMFHSQIWPQYKVTFAKESNARLPLFIDNRWLKWSKPTEFRMFEIYFQKFYIKWWKLCFYMDSNSFLKKSARGVSHFPRSLFWTEMITNVAPSHSGLITPAQQKTHPSTILRKLFISCLCVKNRKCTFAN